MSALKKNTKIKAKKKGEITNILSEVGIDEICSLIEKDMTYEKIALKIGVSETSLNRWLKETQDRFARAKESRIKSANACDDLAMQILEGIPDDGSRAQIARAREIAQHYRWRAKVRNPMEYGDRHIVQGDKDADPVQIIPVLNVTTSKS